MANRARVLIIAGLLLASALTAGAAKAQSPFSGGVEASPKQQKMRNSGDVEASRKQQKTEDAASPAQGTRTANVPSAARAPATISDSKAYRIGQQDVVEISVFGVEELSGTVEVGDNGTLQLPLLGEVQAAGKTEEELQQELTSKLGAEYLQNPQVRVTVKEYKSRMVIVSGDIGKPGVYPLTGETTLLQMIATAGDFKETSDSTVLILRKSGGRRMGAKFDVSEIQAGRASDPVLQPGDSIVAGRSAIKSTFGLFLKALPVAGLFAFF